MAMKTICTVMLWLSLAYVAGIALSPVVFSVR